MLYGKSKKKGHCWTAPCILLLGLVVLLRPAVGGGKFIYDSKGRRSPFSPPVVEGHGRKENVSDQEVVDRIRGMLTGVLWDKERPIAFLVGAEKEVAEVGDVIIEEWRIIDITPKGIVIKKGDKVVDLPIYEEEEDES